ncbi:MAG: ATP synthase F1 subunit delta [Candidatus Omnitrophota bacterium]
MTTVKRYAEAFLEYAAVTIGFEKGLGELRGVRDIFRDNPDFREFLESPAITRAEKCAAVEKVLGEGFSAEIRHFLELLLKKERFGEFDSMVEYARAKYSHGEEVDAVLKVSYPLDTEAMRSIKEALEKKVHKKLHLYIDIDPALLGGVSATIGNTVIDGSVRRRLEDMRDKLMTIKAG